MLNTKTGVFRVYTTKAGDPTTLDRSSSYAIFKDREARIWVTSMSGVNLYNREEDNFTRIRDLGSWIMDIDQDADGNIWFSSQETGCSSMIRISRNGRIMYIAVPRCID